MIAKTSGVIVVALGFAVAACGSGAGRASTTSTTAANATPSNTAIGAPPASTDLAEQAATAPVATRAATVPTTPDPAVDFTEIAPGEMVELPDWPLSERSSPPMVWTGSELIAWGAGIYDSANDGAAYDPTNGTWRVLAPAPLSPRGESAVAWTGTEMIVWGGRISNTFYRDGAAYDPATDTWRLLAPAPADADLADATIVWTGDEAVLIGAGAVSYDPVTDSWHTLADPPSLPPDPHLVWTGDSIVAANAGYGGHYSYRTMERYDVAVDRWTVNELGPSAALVGVPGADGRVSSFVHLPAETGAAVQLIDTAGSPITELPPFPADHDLFGDQLDAYGVGVGDEVLFEIWSQEPDFTGEQIWALSPGTRTWRRLDTDTPFPRIDSSAVVAGDLLLMSNRPGDVYRGSPRACCVASHSRGGVVYRVGIAATD